MSNKYQSTMGGGEITAAQFVMEHFLLLLASQEKRALPKQFWKLDKYKNLWKRHVRSVHARLKEYEVETITTAFKDRRLKNLKSLSKAASWLWKPIFDEYEKKTQEKLKRKNEYITADVENIDDGKERTSPNTRSELTKLLDLDSL